MACFRLSEVSCSYFVPYFRLMLAVPICALFEIVSGQLLLIVPYLRLCKVGCSFCALFEVVYSWLLLFVSCFRLSWVGSF